MFRKNLSMIRQNLSDLHIFLFSSFLPFITEFEPVAKYINRITDSKDFEFLAVFGSQIP